MTDKMKALKYAIEWEYPLELTIAGKETLALPRALATDLDGYDVLLFNELEQTYKNPAELIPLLCSVKVDDLDFEHSSEPRWNGEMPALDAGTRAHFNITLEGKTQ